MDVLEERSGSFFDEISDPGTEQRVPSKLMTPASVGHHLNPVKIRHEI